MNKLENNYASVSSIRSVLFSSLISQFSALCSLIYLQIWSTLNPVHQLEGKNKTQLFWWRIQCDYTAFLNWPFNSKSLISIETIKCCNENAVKQIDRLWKAIEYETYIGLPFIVFDQWKQTQRECIIYVRRISVEIYG